MSTAPTPPPEWPTPEPGWVFVNLPMNRCTGRADRCTVDEIRDGRVIWHVGTNPDPIADTYSTPLFTFAHRMETGEHFTAVEPNIVTSHVRDEQDAMTVIAELLAQQGFPSQPESHCPGYAGITVPLPHGAVVWISEDPDWAPGCVAQYHPVDTDGIGDPVELSEPEDPAAVAADVAAVARTITANCSH